MNETQFFEEQYVCLRVTGGGVVFNNKIYGVIAFGDTTATCTIPIALMVICHHEYLQWIPMNIAKP